MKDKIRLIRNFVDRSLEVLFVDTSSLRYVSDSSMPEEMRDTEIPETSLGIPWKPVRAKIKDAEIRALEDKIGYRLPLSYLSFLNYKHFYHLGNLSSLRFPPHPSHRWKNEFLNLVFVSRPETNLLKKGLVPFADFPDSRLACFHTNMYKNGEYEIVTWSEKDPNNIYPLAENFPDLLNKILKNEIA